jgi:hypothetical protein
MAANNSSIPQNQGTNGSNISSDAEALLSYYQ